MKKLYSILFMKIPVEKPLQRLRRIWHRVFYGERRPWTGVQSLALVAVFIAIAYGVGYATGKADGSYERQGLDEQIFPLEAENYGLRRRLGISQCAELDPGKLLEEAVNGKRGSATPIVSATATPTVGVGAPAGGTGAEAAH